MCDKALVLNTVNRACRGLQAPISLQWQWASRVDHIPHPAITSHTTAITSHTTAIWWWHVAIQKRRMVENWPKSSPSQELVLRVRRAVNVELKMRNTWLHQVKPESRLPGRHRDRRGPRPRGRHRVRRPPRLDRGARWPVGARRACAGAAVAVTPIRGRPEEPEPVVVVVWESVDKAKPMVELMLET